MHSKVHTGLYKWQKLVIQLDTGTVPFSSSKSDMHRVCFIGLYLPRIQSALCMSLIPFSNILDATLGSRLIANIAISLAIVATVIFLRIEIRVYNVYNVQYTTLTQITSWHFRYDGIGFR